MRFASIARTVAVAALLGAVAAARAAGPAMETEIDLLVRDGYEQPAQSLAALDEWQRSHADTVESRRLVLQAIGMVHAGSGANTEAGVDAEHLLALSREDPSGRALASSNLVRALVAENAGQLDVAAALAQAALPVFRAGCDAREPSASCDYRSAFRALQTLEKRALNRGAHIQGEQDMRAALALAEAAGDTSRSADAYALLAHYAQARDEGVEAQRLIGIARRLAVQANDLRLQARVANVEGFIAGQRGDGAGAIRGFEHAHALALRANAPRLVARANANLSDAYSKAGRHAEALRAAELAIPVVRKYQDFRAESILINNAGIAKIGLGRVAEGKQDMARLLDMWDRGGDTGRKATTLLEFGEALGAAGDWRGALEAYHRERSLSAELMRANRAAALKELQTHNDADARQRDIELLERDNALKTAELANGALKQRIGWLIAAVLALGAVLVALLYRRVRRTHRQLSDSHEQLQVQSERDPLTDLANRRHFQAVMARHDAQRSFEGALLLVDIDHFKHVNDSLGHAAGDRVIVEVGRRLADSVRGEDLVVRWGGEEFLVFAPRASAEQADQMAERVLRAIATTPVALEGGAAPVRVSVSIGYARFPLPPHQAQLSWEQAINLSDMALYTAKNQGRNQAVGIVATTASTREALREIEADFEQACHQGRVSLRHAAGPSAPGQLRAA